MTYEVIMAGFGGQGLLFSGKVLAYAGLLEDRELSWLPSQRTYDPPRDHPRADREMTEYGLCYVNRICSDRKSTRLNSSHTDSSRMPSSA